MLRKAKSLSGYKLLAIDGEIGNVKEFYFDDRHWTVRYLIADTGNWLADRQVLISPRALVDVLIDTQHITVNLTKKQIEDSPSILTDKPVSRQYEEIYHGHYGWPIYWDGPNMWGAYPFIIRDLDKGNKPPKGDKTWDHNLRSARDVAGHHIHAVDGEIGHVEDFVIDDQTWAIRYIVIDTRNWWPGKKVLVSPKWIERVSWDESAVFVNLFRDTIKQSPEYSEEVLLSRHYEDELHKHYDREGYWVGEPPYEM